MSETKGRKREPITEVREIEIIALIDDWDPAKADLTREALVRRVKCKTGMEFTRQGLMKRNPIRLAFLRREKEIAGDAKPRADKEALTVALEKKVEALNAVVKERGEVIDKYKQLFLTYRHNARQHGLTREQLEAPITPRNQPEGSRG